jgi:hypothetical protein
MVNIQYIRHLQYKEWCKRQDTLEMEVHMNLLPHDFSFNLIASHVSPYKTFTSTYILCYLMFSKWPHEEMSFEECTECHDIRTTYT